MAEPAPEPLSAPLASNAADPPRAEQRVVLEGPPDTVWDLLTDPDQLVHWLGRPVDLDFEDGGEGHLIDVDGTERGVRVVEVEAARSIRWDWWPVGDHEATSTVEITLLPVGTGTEVRVVEASTSPTAITCSTRARAGAGRWGVTCFIELELALIASGSLVASSAQR